MTTVMVGAMVVPIFILNSTKIEALTCSNKAQCEAMKAEKEQQKALYQAEVSRLKTEADTLSSALATLASEKSIIQAQIDINQAESDRLEIEIADTEKKIKNNQEALGVTIANMYVEDEITPLEMIASSRTISDYLDAREYRTSVRSELATTITEVKSLKKSLDEQKEAITKILGDQINARQALTDKENQQQEMINKTQGQERLYQQLTAKAEAELLAIADAYKSLTYTTGTGISDPSKGNYPWATNCTVGYDLMSYGGYNGNGNDPLGYACRQCTSYAAWKMLEYTGKSYVYWGHAKSWANSASNLGLSVGGVARANSVGVITSGTYGHVVWVETDPDADGNIIISQYNSYYDNTGDSSGNGWGNYSKKKVSAYAYDRFVYFD